MSVFRCDVPSAELLQRLLAAPLPCELKAERETTSAFRDLYLDSPDGALKSRDVACRVRMGADDRRTLSLSARGGGEGKLTLWEADVPDVDPRAALAGTSEPARRLRGFVDPAILRPRVEIEVARTARVGVAGFFSRSRFELVYDVATVRTAGLSRSFQELTVKKLRSGRLGLSDVAAALEKEYGLRTILASKLDRAVRLLEALDSEAMARAVGSGRAVTVIVLDEGRIAFHVVDGSLRLPSLEGSGEEACRFLLRQQFGSAVAELRLLGTAPALGTRPTLEVWLARRLRRAEGSGVHRLVPLEEAVARVGSPALRDPGTLAALHVAVRSDLLEEEAREKDPRSSSSSYRALTVLPDAPAPKAGPPTGSCQLLDGELSLLEFNARVLALAEDESVPLLSRVFFLSVASANLDELFMVRVAGLKRLLEGGEGGEGAAERGNGLSLAEQLDTLGLRARAFVERLELARRTLVAALGRSGIRLLRWADLPPSRKLELRQDFQGRIFPLLSPRAITVTPGHPFPIIPNLVLSLAVVVRDHQTGPTHFAQLRIPSDVPRFVAVAEGLLPLEDVVRANLDLLYPDREIAGAYLFRITRSSDLEVDEEVSGNLLQAIEEEVQNRGTSQVVRVEVEKGMPRPVRELLLREIGFERGREGAPVTDADVYEVPGLLDPSAFKEIAALDRPDLKDESYTGRDPLPQDRSLWELLREKDVLAHHPYERFETTVLRFFREAAADPDVVSLKSTLYRTGDGSPVVAALIDAAARGKDVAVFMELKARFDEERNVGWARRLTEAGIHVVHGLVGLKNHAKVALVVRREGKDLARYVHIGTGNYNAGTARAYTDLSLLSADEELGADVNDLFNGLTGSSRAPKADFRKILVAPRTLLPGLLSRIEREARLARTGRRSGIRMKLNGLSDPKVVAALYEASQAGVPIDLVVRGICTLRPGVPGLSPSIRVVSLLGRFLEHARIYWFENDGAPEVFLGSADLRPRNLRRRVEVVAPVEDPACRERLRHILDAELADPFRWNLGPHGSYLRGEAAPGVTSAQQDFMSGVDLPTQGPT